MKTRKNYQSPVLNAISLTSECIMIAISGQGDRGDHAECKEFWGPTLFDQPEGEDEFAAPDGLCFPE